MLCKTCLQEIETKATGISFGQHRNSGFLIFYPLHATVSDDGSIPSAGIAKRKVGRNHRRPRQHSLFCCQFYILFLPALTLRIPQFWNLRRLVVYPFTINHWKILMKWVY